MASDERVCGRRWDAVFVRLAPARPGWLDEGAAQHRPVLAAARLACPNHSSRASEVKRAPFACPPPPPCRCAPHAMCCAGSIRISLHSTMQCKSTADPSPDCHWFLSPSNRLMAFLLSCRFSTHGPYLSFPFEHLQPLTFCCFCWTPGLFLFLSPTTPALAARHPALIHSRPAQMLTTFPPPTCNRARAHRLTSLAVWR